MGEVTVQALRGIDLEIYEREFVVLLGPSCSGKSTLLNILGGLETATAGEVLWRDHDLVHADDRELTQYRREHVGFVFQFYNLIPSLTVRENVALVTDLVAHPMDPEEALCLVGLAHRLDHFPSQLSGGEQQRVAIARINQELGTTAIVITHNAAIAGMADRVLRLADGQIVAVEHNPYRLSPQELRW
jgi:putative ABC transport system ATP-binding protein